MTEMKNGSTFRGMPLIIFWASVGFLTFGILIGYLLPRTRVWGFHFLSYYSPTGCTIFMAIGLLTAVLTALMIHSRERTASAKNLSDLTADVLVAATAGFVFYFMAAPAQILGDGQLWLNELNSGGGYVWQRRGPLTLGMYFGLYKLLFRDFTHGAVLSFQFGASAIGAITTFIWLRLARLTNTPWWVVLLLISAWGGIVQFFGYAELYAAMIAVIAAMLVLMLRSIRRGRADIAVFFLALVAPLFHFIGFTFWPAAILYGWWAATRKVPAAKWVLGIVFACFIMAAAFYFLSGWHRGTEVLLPMVGASAHSPRGFFSLAHIADLLNGIGLAGGPIIALILWFFVTRHSDAAPNRVLERQILALAVGIPLAAYSIHNSHLGMARDWDIAATCLSALPAAAMLAWEEARKSIRFGTAVLCTFAIWFALITLPWIGINSSEAKTLARFENLLHLDPATSASGWDYLGAYYGRTSQIREIEHCYREALKVSSNIRYHRELVVCLAAQRKWDDAFEQARLVRDSVFADSIVSHWEARLIDIRPCVEVAGKCLAAGDFDAGYQAYRLALELNPQSRIAQLALTGLLVCSGRVDQAETKYRELFAADSTLEPAANRFFDALINQLSHPVEGWLGMSVLARLSGDLTTAEKCAAHAYALSERNSVVKSYWDKIRGELKSSN